jgi:hypothetical protein
MSVRSDRRLRLLFVTLVLVLVASVAVSVGGVLAVLSALVSAGSGAWLELVVLETALGYGFVLTGLGLSAVGLAAWLLVRAVRIAEPPRSDRLARVARFAEGFVPGLAAIGVANAVEPRFEDRQEALKERYARGELTERELERELERLLEAADDYRDDRDDLEGSFDAAFDDLDVDVETTESASNGSRDPGAVADVVIHERVEAEVDVESTGPTARGR